MTHTDIFIYKYLETHRNRFKQQNNEKKKFVKKKNSGIILAC